MLVDLSKPDSGQVLENYKNFYTYRGGNWGWESLSNLPKVVKTGFEVWPILKSVINLINKKDY